MSEIASSDVSSTPKKRTWDACAGLHEAESPLLRLDNKVVFGGDYPEPIRYDAERKKLRYRGFMSHASYVKLAALSDERDFQSALERLFVATSPSAVAPPWQTPWKAVGLAVAAAIIVACGWFARGAWLRPEVARHAGEDHVVTQQPDAAGDIVAHAPQAADALSEGEPHRPVER